MLNYREFEAGPDPFGRKYQVLFKWLQTAISIRHSDTVDVKFILTEIKGGEPGARTQKTIALPHADLRALSRETGRAIDDPWCARIAVLHLKHLIATGEDLEKDLITVNPEDLRTYAAELAREDQAAVKAG
jgi:hypothetical protein